MYDKYKLKPARPRPRHGRIYRLGSYEPTVSFDFVANTTLEECLSRTGSLQDLRDLDPWVPVVRVNLRHIDDHTYAFIIREAEPAPVELRGYMNRLDETTTYVSGEASAKVTRQIMEFASLVLLIVLLSMFVGFFVAVLFLPILGGFIWYYWRGARKERDRLVAVIRDTLSSS